MKITPKNFIRIDNYSARNFPENKYFNGRLTLLIKGAELQKPFYFKCPFCGLFGADLQHENWFEAKGDSADLYIICANNHRVNTDNKKEVIDWLVVE